MFRLGHSNPRVKEAIENLMFSLEKHIAPAAREEVAETLKEWLNQEFEIHGMQTQIHYHKSFGITLSELKNLETKRVANELSQHLFKKSAIRRVPCAWEDGYPQIPNDPRYNQPYYDQIGYEKHQMIVELFALRNKREK